MPSSLASGGPKVKSLKGGFRSGRLVPDFFVTVNIAAADFGGANSGKCVFTVPSGLKAVFLGGTEVHTTAGNNPIRIKKVVAGNTSAPGAAADANNVDLTDAIVTTTTANTPLNFGTVSDKGFEVLNAGDRVCVAASLQNTGLAGGVLQLRFAWI